MCSGARPVSGRSISAITVALAGLLVQAAGEAQDAAVPALPPVGVPGPQITNGYGSSPKVVVPLIFPVSGNRVSWSDSFGAPRDGGQRSHRGQDLMAPKMTPVMAAFAGTVQFHRSDAPNVHNMLWLQGVTGWTAAYMHLNNDTPGTDDGQGSADYAFAPGLQPGDQVAAGQFLGWVGDSGNAESTGPHLHFELEGPDGVVNAAPSLRQARKLPAPEPSLPSPDLPVAPGETRIDGALRSVDLTQELLCVDLIATQTHSRKPALCTAPARRWMSLQGASVTRPGEADTDLSWEQVPRGTWVTAFVQYRGATKAAPAFRITLQPSRGILPPAQPAAVATSEPQGGLPLQPKADTWLPLLEERRSLRTIASSSPLGEAGSRITLAGGWDGQLLHLSLTSRQSFRARLELGGQVFRLDDGGLYYQSGPEAGEAAAGAVIRSQDAAGGLSLRILLPLKLILPARMAEPGASAEPQLRLRITAELGSGTEVSIPGQMGEWVVRLVRRAPAE